MVSQLLINNLALGGNVKYETTYKQAMNYMSNITVDLQVSPFGRGLQAFESISKQ